MRSLAEWLVVPLLLLPVVAGAGLVLWAQDAHRRAQAPFRRQGAATAATWLSPGGPAEWMTLEGPWRAVTPPPFLVPCHHPRSRFVVHLSCPTRGTAPWRFEEDLASPLSPALLVEPGVRLALETGAAPVEVEGAAPAALAFRHLLGGQDLEALRTAPLPCATKRYLLGRWVARLDGPPRPPLAAADQLLEVVDRLLEAWQGPLPRGQHRVAGLTVFSYGGAEPDLVLANDREAPGLWTDLREAGPPDGAARLVWEFPDAARFPRRLLWRGRVEAPLAGRFAFHARWRSWWQAPWVRRWIGPVIALLLASLLLPLALLVSIRKRRRLDEARIRFINEMAHDLRTPLASLRLHADMLSEGRGKPEKREGYLHLLSREAARLSSLLANLLDLSRLEQGRRRLETGTVDIGSLAYRSVRELALLHPDREPDLETEGPASTWARADPTALSRCLANLLENAGKFTPAGTAIRVTWALEGPEVILRVTDEGPGIPPAERRRIFERYARGARARRDGVPGTGLGLSLVEELVEGMGGTVTLIQSEVGAAFEIRLPGARA